MKNLHLFIYSEKKEKKKTDLSQLNKSEWCRETGAVELIFLTQGK